MFQVVLTRCQDYEVADIKCNLYGDSAVSSVGSKQQLVARLKKPEYFRGHPLFADDLKVNPRNDPYCSIVSEPGDISGRIYRLTITDLSRCGVTHHSVSKLQIATNIKELKILIFNRLGLCPRSDLVPTFTGRYDVTRPRSYFSLQTPRIYDPHFQSDRAGQHRVTIDNLHQNKIFLIHFMRPLVRDKRGSLASWRKVLQNSSTKSPYIATWKRASIKRQSPFNQMGSQRLAEQVLTYSRWMKPSRSALNYNSERTSAHKRVSQFNRIEENLNKYCTIFERVAWKYVKLVEVTVSTDRQDPHAEGHVRLLHLGWGSPL